MEGLPERDGRVGILTVLATALVGGIICADAFSLRSVSVEAASFRVHLGSVRILQAQGGIDGATCDALSRIPGCAREPFARSNPG